MKDLCKRFVIQIFTAAISICLGILPAGAQIDNQKIQDYLEQVRIESGIPGISAAVAVNNEILFSGGAGYADLENQVQATGATIYRIASISKPIGGIGVMQLLEQGKVSLQDDIRKYVPSFPEKKWTVTLWHLFTHTSGIRHYNQGEFGKMEHFKKLEDAINIFKDDPLKYQPGTQTSYTTYGFNLLQGVIETAGEMELEEYMRKNVWIPAGMLNTSFEIKDRIVYNRARGYSKVRNKIVNSRYTDASIKWIGGGMISTVEDLVKVFVALDNGVLLKPEIVQQMYSIQYPEGETKNGRALSWGVRTDNKGRRIISHSGGAMGFSSMLINYPDQKIVVAVIVNNDFYSGTGTVANNIAQYFLPYER